MDGDLDLVFSRVINVPRDHVWRCWTEPALLKQWFTPEPWRTIDCEIDLRPGGIFRTVMRGPEGQQHDGAGCFLEVGRPERLVWTDALGPGYRPTGVPFITAILTLGEPEPGYTSYTAHVLHKDKADCERHAALNFHEGWGKACDQLVALARTL